MKHILLAFLLIASLACAGYSEMKPRWQHVVDAESEILGDLWAGRMSAPEPAIWP